MLGPRSHECDVILLLATAAELLDRPGHCLENGSRRQVRMARKSVQQAGLAKLFPVRVRCFGDSICLE
jgi:hypothetical protein